MLQINEFTYKIEAADLKEIFKERKKDTNKGDYGYVGIFGGSLEYSGAVKLANLSVATLRSGCGAVRLIVPKSLANIVAPYLLEQTMYQIDEQSDGKMIFNKEQIDSALNKLKALAIGMGRGQSKEYKKILHLKEFERLSKIKIEDIKKDEINIAKKFAIENNVILLLKGPTTIVTNGEKVYLIKRGCPGMATAGSGDVLSGILVGLLGYSKPDILTVSAGAYLNGLTGEIAEKKIQI